MNIITESSKGDVSEKTSTDRFLELADQNWTREKSRLLAKNEGIDLNDDHWEVILYLRKRYLLVGLPAYMREFQNELGRYFLIKGGTSYLSNLFPDGLVTQGSRIANIPEFPC